MIDSPLDALSVAIALLLLGGIAEHVGGIRRELALARERRDRADRLFEARLAAADREARP